MIWETLLTLLLATAPADFQPWMDEIAAWEDDIRQLEQVDQDTQDPEDAVLFVGSSSIRLWDDIAADMAPYPVIQRGYGGAKFSDVAYYAQRLVFPHRFQALVVFVGNDISGSDRDKTPEQVAGFFAHFLNVVRSRYPEVPVLCMDVRPTPSRWKSWPEIAAGNAALRAVCETDDHAYFVATSRAFLTPDGTPREDLHRDDRLHLNRAGYQLWAQQIADALAQAAVRPPASTP